MAAFLRPKGAEIFIAKYCDSVTRNLECIIYVLCIIDDHRKKWVGRQRRLFISYYVEIYLKLLPD